MGVVSRIIGTATGALTLVCLSLSPAAAGQLTSTDTPIVESTNTATLFVTPDELRDMGESEEGIAAQEALFDSMTPAELAVQDRLRQEQETLKDDLLAEPDVFVPSAIERPEMTPYTYVTVCYPGNDYYSVFYSHGGVDCFANAGTRNYSSPGLCYATKIRPGNNVGRLYYHDGTYYQWSPWRGKSMIEYKFNAPVPAYAVQIA